MTKRVNRAGAGVTQTASDAATNVGNLTNDTVGNVKNTADSAVGDLSSTVTNTGTAIGKKDIKGVGAGIAKGELHFSHPSCLRLADAVPQVLGRLYPVLDRAPVLRFPESDMVQVLHFLAWERV